MKHHPFSLIHVRIINQQPTLRIVGTRPRSLRWPSAWLPLEQANFYLAFSSGLCSSSPSQQTILLFSSTYHLLLFFILSSLIALWSLCLDSNLFLCLPSNTDTSCSWKCCILYRFNSLETTKSFSYSIAASSVFIFFIKAHHSGLGVQNGIKQPRARHGSRAECRRAA